MSRTGCLRIVGAILTALVFPVGGPVLGEDSFFVGLEDMPVMAGLTQLADRSVSFDAPAGRIVELSAEGSVTRQAVLEFYERTLPQLGWQSTGSGTFRRDGETLRLEFPQPGRTSTHLTVRFFLSPG
jgi:hypothetical protein